MPRNNTVSFNPAPIICNTTILHYISFFFCDLLSLSPLIMYDNMSFVQGRSYTHYQLISSHHHYLHLQYCAQSCMLYSNFLFHIIYHLSIVKHACPLIYQSINQSINQSIDRICPANYNWQLHAFRIEKKEKVYKCKKK